MNTKPNATAEIGAKPDKGLSGRDYETAAALIGIRRDAEALRALLLAQYYEARDIELSSVQDATLSAADRIAERSQEFLKKAFPDSVLDFANF
jgi:hypothetical protein